MAIILSRAAQVARPASLCKCGQLHNFSARINGLRKLTCSFHQAFKSCLVSREYMRVRNVIVVMTRIAPFFPVIDAHGKDLVACIEALIAEEKRGDLKVLAQG